MKKILLFIAAVMTAMTVSAVTFNVTVPAGTQVCYVAGAPSWSHVQMEKVSDTQFTLTTDALDGTAYKYCAGDGWAYVEKDESGEEVSDRTYSENDVVAAWLATQEEGAASSYTWAVCGVGELVGDAWDPASEANEMTESNGVFTLVKYGVELTPDFMTDADDPEKATQGYGYKVAANDDWGIKEFPTGGANQFLVVDAAGTYDVTFTWNPAANELTATYVPAGDVPSVDIDEVDAEDAVVAAYDLLGRPVAADAAGYVILQYASGKAAKVYNN